MKNRYIIYIIILCLIMSMITACNPTVKVSAPTHSPTPVVTSIPSPTPAPDRVGSYLDNIFMFKANEDTAAKQVLDGTLDIYASGLYSDQIEILDDSYIELSPSTSRQYELLVNPADTDRGFNPFKYKKIRQSLNVLIDRSYIKDNIFSGNAVETMSPIIYGSNDYNKYKDTIKTVNDKYSYDFDKASESISNTLLEVKYVAKNDEGKWTYKEKPITIIVLIRNDDKKRTTIGDYIADQLDKLGFTTQRRYLSQTECNSLWAGSDPQEGLWHLYTGRRTFESLDTNMDRVFLDHYTALGNYSHLDLYKSFEVKDEFKEKAQQLATTNYKDISERDNLFSSLLETCNDYSYRIWLVDELIYCPYSPKLSLTNHTSTLLANDIATIYTLQKKDTWGGQINWGTNDLLSGASNPVGGSSSEKQFLNFTELPLIAKNNDTGTTKPLFIKSAQATFDSSLGYIDDCSWADVSTSNEIKVPNDAILSWDDKDQSIIYADKDYLHDNVGLATAWLATYERERPKDRDKIKKQQATIKHLQSIEDRGYLTCNVKYVIEYDESIYNLKWQDGSPLNVADIVMSFMTKTELVTKTSSLYDEYIAENYLDKLSKFKGFRVTSVKPLIIEYYTDEYDLYVSNNIKPFWVDYINGQQSWAIASVANHLIDEGAAFYTKGSANDNGTTHLDYLKGDSLSLLEKSTSDLKVTGFIPYKALLEQYITPDDAKVRYDNILKFYKQYGHFNIGLGPYVINNVDPLAPALTLAHYDGLDIKSDELASYFLSD